MRIQVPKDECEQWDESILQSLAGGPLNSREICVKLGIVPKTFDGVVIIRRLQAMRVARRVTCKGTLWSATPRAPGRGDPRR